MSAKIVRLATVDDADAVFGLWKRLAKDHVHKQHPESEAEDIQADNMYVKLIGSTPNCKVIVVEEDSNIIGFAEFYIYEPNDDFQEGRYAYVLHCFVEEEKRDFTTFSMIFNAIKKYLESIHIKYWQADVYANNENFYNKIKLLKFQPYRTRFMRVLDETE